jgi:hypothetical protein
MESDIRSVSRCTVLRVPVTSGAETDILVLRERTLRAGSVGSLVAGDSAAQSTMEGPN